MRTPKLLPLALVAGSLLLGSAVLVGPVSSVANACPFCAAVSQTFAQEMESMDVVVLAEFVHGRPESPRPGSNEEIPKSTFRITHCVKGESWVKADQEITVDYFGKPDKKAAFLIMGTDPPSLMWSRPLAMSDAGKAYLLNVASLPKEKERLKFFLDYLEDADEMLARDAYDEFARAPYEDVIALRNDIDREQMIAWINDKDVPVSRRRLYLTMLGVAGKAQDAEMLEGLMRSDDRKKKAGLDAMVACYLTLLGEDGLATVEELFLGNKDAEYSDTYAAIMAYRFHGSEGNVIERKKLLKGLRMVLDRPDLADLVIPDLARWEDWETMPKLVQLFRQADEDSNWVRVPVVNYLRACPLPKAKKEMEELAKIDPDAIKRASVFFPVTKPGAKQRKEKAKAEAEKESSGEAVKRPAPVGG